MTLRWTAVVLGLGLLLGCGGSSSPPAPDLSPAGREKMAKELDSQRRRWESKRPEEYSYSLNKICLCPYPVLYPLTVTVEGDARSALSSDGKTVPDSVRVESIEQLFTLGSGAIRQAASVYVIYDARWGVPSRLSIGRWEGSDEGEVSYSVEILSP